MISAGELRNGVTMEYEGEIYSVLEFQHVKPGKGAAFVRTRLKNIKTGAVVEKTFRPTEKMSKAHIDRQDMQYLYNDGELYHFMNNETFDQIALNADDVGDALKFVKENENVKILSHDGNVFGIEPPLFVELEITEIILPEDWEETGTLLKEIAKPGLFVVLLVKKHNREEYFIPSGDTELVSNDKLVVLIHSENLVSVLETFGVTQ